MYLDRKGLIVQSDGDGGDTLQREGFWYEGSYLTAAMRPPGMASYDWALAFLYAPNGYVRNWAPPYNDPTDTSRDQLVSNIRACGYYGYTHVLRIILEGVIRNWSRFPNGDIAFINDYGRFIRSYRARYLSPFLWLCDVAILVNSIIRVIASRDPNNVGDDVNHIGDLAQAQNIYPTLVSWLARKIYKFRLNGPQYALDWYFRPESGANSEFADLWAPIITKF